MDEKEVEEWVERIADAVVRKLDERRKIELIAEAVIEKLRERGSLEAKSYRGDEDEETGEATERERQ